MIKEIALIQNIEAIFAGLLQARVKLVKNLI